MFSDRNEYVIDKVRHAPEQSTFIYAPPTALGITAAAEAAPLIHAPRMAPGIGGHNISLPPARSRPFGSDIAIKDLRQQLSLDLDLLQYEASPRMAPGIGGYNIGPPPPRLRPSEGDIAIKDLRQRLSLDTDLVRQPPIRTGRKVTVRWIGSSSLALILAAIAAFGVTLMMPDEARNQARRIANVMILLLGSLSRTGTLAHDRVIDLGNGLVA
jgi:hypothetical protein